MVACARELPVTREPARAAEPHTASITSPVAGTRPLEARPAPAALRVAITFDDLGASQASSERAVSERILGALDAAGAPVAVFVNCQALEPSTLLLWQRAGATIGNHTATHLSVDTVDAAGAWAEEQWWRDVESCHDRLARLLHEPVRYFRFPYLRYGKGAERRRAAASKLASLGYVTAHVTAATSEWLLANYYDAARGRDRALTAEIVEAYVEHVRESSKAARQIANAKLGRDVAQITLLHVNRLAADHLPSVLDALRQDGYSFVSLSEALADPVYSLADAYSGGCGCSWLARIAPALTPNDEYVFGDYEQQIQARFQARVAALATD